MDSPCTLCGHTATHFCLCDYPLHCFCSSCLALHTAAHSHPVFPIHDITNLTSKIDYTQAKVRLAALEAAYVAAQTNFPLLHTYKSHLETAFSASISYLQSLQAREIAEIEELEAKLRVYIEEIIEELKRNVINSEYRPKPGLATIAWAFRTDSDSLAVQFFEFQRGEISEKRLRDGVNVFFDIGIMGFPEEPSLSLPPASPSSDPPSHFPFIFEDFMLGFDWKSDLWLEEVSLSRSIAAYANSVVSELPDGTILCTGGGLEGEESSKSYQIERIGTVKVLSNMRQGRSFHSQIVYNTTVYVFGGQGRGDSLATCEKLFLLPLSSLLTRQWQSLSPLNHPREGCTPCVFSDCIYLCGGGTDTCESFSIPKERFSLLFFHLPDSNSPTITIPFSNQLYIISHEDVTIWTVDTQEVEYKRHPQWGSWGNTQAEVVDGKVKWGSVMLGGVVVVDLREMSMKVVGFREE